MRNGSLTVDVLVVGAGPAGLSAAAAAAETGANVLVVDQNPELGGQYLRALPDEWSEGAPWTAGTRRHRSELIRAATNARVAVMSGASVFDFAPGYRLGIQSCVTSEVRWVDARRVIVATGAYEAVVPFPGWTLPGVMTIGGAQNLAKSQGLAPGARIVLSGTGPFLWLVADNLIRRGVHVVAVAEATSLAASLRFALRVRPRGGLATEAISYWSRILTRSRLLFARAAVAAQGDGRVERVTVARVDSRSRVVPGGELTIAADALCASYGLIPCTEITRLIGCEHVLDAASGASIPIVNDLLETSQPGVFAAGETLGVAGWQVAECEGRIAGLAAAASLGLMSVERARVEASATRGLVSRQRAFAREMLATYSLGRGLLTWQRDETLACRCEEVTVRTIRQAIEFGDSSTDEIKSRTRAGMGRCQGRVCGYGVQVRLAEALGAPNLPPQFRVRPPVRPVTIGDLVAASPDEGRRVERSAPSGTEA
jgi:NADPH-dependent 2,4-dienoyl-CoA reductase/sulfur reductase-like enzyme